MATGHSGLWPDTACLRERDAPARGEQLGCCSVTAVTMGAVLAVVGGAGSGAQHRCGHTHVQTVAALLAADACFIAVVLHRCRQSSSCGAA
jgi:hypothetical protein